MAQCHHSRLRMLGCLLPLLLAALHVGCHGMEHGGSTLERKVEPGHSHSASGGSHGGGTSDVLQRLHAGFKHQLEDFEETLVDPRQWDIADPGLSEAELTAAAAQRQAQAHRLASGAFQKLKGARDAVAGTLSHLLHLHPGGAEPTPSLQIQPAPQQQEATVRSTADQGGGESRGLEPAAAMYETAIAKIIAARDATHSLVHAPSPDAAEPSLEDYQRAAALFDEADRYLSAWGAAVHQQLELLTRSYPDAAAAARAAVTDDMIARSEERLAGLSDMVEEAEGYDSHGAHARAVEECDQVEERAQDAVRYLSDAEAAAIGGVGARPKTPFGGGAGCGAGGASGAGGAARPPGSGVVSGGAWPLSSTIAELHAGLEAQERLATALHNLAAFPPPASSSTSGKGDDRAAMTAEHADAAYKKAVQEVKELREAAKRLLQFEGRPDVPEAAALLRDVSVSFSDAAAGLRRWQQELQSAGYGQAAAAAGHQQEEAARDDAQHEQEQQKGVRGMASKLLERVSHMLGSGLWRSKSWPLPGAEASDAAEHAAQKAKEAAAASTVDIGGRAAAAAQGIKASAEKVHAQAQATAEQAREEAVAAAKTAGQAVAAAANRIWSLAAAAAAKASPAVQRARSTVMQAGHAAGDVASAAGERVKAGAERAQEVAAAAGQGMKQRAQEAGAAAAERAHAAAESPAGQRLREQATAVGAKMGEAATSAQHRAQEAAAEGAHMAGDAAAAAGHTAREAAARARQAARQALDAAAHRLAEQAAAAGQRVKEAASEGGHKVQDMAVAAGHAAQEAAAAAAHKAQDVAGAAAHKAGDAAAAAGHRAKEAAAEAAHSAVQAAAAAQHAAQERAAAAGAKVRHAAAEAVDEAEAVAKAAGHKAATASQSTWHAAQARARQIGPFLLRAAVAEQRKVQRRLSTVFNTVTCVLLDALRFSAAMAGSAVADCRAGYQKALAAGHMPPDLTMGPAGRDWKQQQRPAHVAAPPDQGPAAYSAAAPLKQAGEAAGEAAQAAAGRTKSLLSHAPQQLREAWSRVLTGLGTAGHKLGELAHLHPGAPPAPEKGPSEAAARAAEEARLAGEHALQQMVTVVHIVAANDNLLGQQQPEALEALRDAMGMMQELQRSLAAIRWAAAGQGRLASMAHSLMDYLQAIDERLFVEGLMADSQREAAGRRFHTTAEGLLRAAEEAVLGGMVGGGQKLAEAARDLGLSGVGGGIGAAAPPAPPGPAEAEQPKSVAQAGAQLLRRIGWAIKGASSGAWSRARTAGRGAVMGATSVGHVLAWPIRLAGQPLLTSMKGKPGGVSRPAVSRVEEEEGMAAMPWPPAELQAGPGQPLQASVAQALPPTAATAHALHELAEVQRYIQDMQELIGHEGGGSSSSSRKRT